MLMNRNPRKESDKCSNPSCSKKFKKGCARNMCQRCCFRIKNASSVSVPSNQIATLGDINTINTGDITFDGSRVIGAGTGSGDGSGNGTIELVPDGTLETDQYIIIDPTAPNHIHVRAGGTQDDSSADLFLGGERNHVRVSDNGRNVSITSRPAAVNNTYTNLNPTGNTFFVVSNTANIYVGDTAVYPGDGNTITVDSVTADSPEAGLQTITANLDGTPTIFVTGDDYYFIHNSELNNYWEFKSDGYLSGPAEGDLLVTGLNNNQGNLFLSSGDNVVLNGSDGEYLNEVSPENQIATIGDLPTGATGTFETSDSKIVTVTDGIITSIESLT
jgi:hypothetical protein